MWNLYPLELLCIVAFVLSSTICYGVVLKINSKRDLDHRIPIFKSFLYALIWMPAFMLAIFGILSLL